MSTTGQAPGSASDRPPANETITVANRRDPGGATTGLPDRAPPFLPVIPGFRVVRWLGGGGMGDVYEVVDEGLGVTFALKTVRPDRTHVAYAERFRQEVRAMAGLDHPNIARYYARGDIDGWPYFTMKFVRGGTLADRRAAYRADPRAAVSLLVKVTDAVEYLHARGLVHRDLKPSNILIDEGGEPCLSDFGLVKDVGDPPDAVDARRSAAETIGHPAFTDTQTLVPPPDAPTLTKTGGVIGTFAYMSPEQARGDKERIGPATDIWALGVILYELLTGHRPDQESDTDTAPADAESPARAAGRVPVGADPELARIVARCLVEDVGHRYPSAGLLAADLRRWLGQKPAAPGRRWWRIAAAVGATLALAVVVYAPFHFAHRADDNLPPPADPADPAALREWMRQELQAGRAVPLIDETGNPQPVYRFLIGERHSKTERDPAGWWTIHSTAVALVEFLDDPGVDAYTLTGEVRGELTARLPWAGLFAAHRRVTDPGGDWDFQLEYAYREDPASYAPAGGPVVAPNPEALPKGVKTYPAKTIKRVGQDGGDRRFLLHGLQPEHAGNVREQLADASAIGADRPVSGGPWRALAIRADGASFSVSWNGKDEHSTGEIPAHRLESLQTFLKARPDPPLQFTARGGLGVYVEGGSASFRNLRIVPRATD